MPECSSEKCVCRSSKDAPMAIASHPGSTAHSENGSDNDSDVWRTSGEDEQDYEGDADSNTERYLETGSRDLAALKRRHENRGYLDGLTKGGEIGLQMGFDSGYPLGAQLGGLTGELVAETVWRHSTGQIDDDTRAEALAELQISKVLSSEYFDSDLNMENPRDHPLIRKWSQYYCKLGPP